MRSFIMRLGAVVLTALLTIGLLSAPAHAESATLSGTITSDSTGEPVGGCVTIYDTDDNYVGNTCSDDTGTWSIDVEAGMAYKIEVAAYDGHHLSEWAQDAATFDDAATVIAPAIVDTGLQVGGTIGGTLTRPDGSPAEGASVTVLRADDQTPVAWAGVHAGPPAGEAEWWVPIAPGDYIVEYRDGMAHQYAVGQISADAATRFTVTADSTTRVDDQFLAAAKVSGRIVSDATGEPIEGACAVILQAAAIRDDAWWAGEGCAGPDGRYEVELSEPGSYVAEFTDAQGNHVGEFSGDAAEFGDATAFEASREAPAVVDASLAVGSVISGRAVDAKSGAPIQDACPNAYVGHAGAYVHGAVSECSGSDGQWKLKGLRAGSYALSFDAYSEPRTYATTWAFKATSQKAATLIAVGSATTKTVRNVQMMPGGSVTGVITGPTGEPVAGAWVRLDFGYPGRIGPGEGPHTAQTDENGRYTIHGVPPGEHAAFVYTSYEHSFAPEWSGNGLTSEDATPLRVKALKSTAFNAQLAPASSLAITVVGADGQPDARYLTGFIYNAAGDYIGDFDNAGGAVYGPGALPAGGFTLTLEDGETGEVYWYDGVTRESGQTALTLGEGEHKEITFRLR